MISIGGLNIGDKIKVNLDGLIGRGRITDFKKERDVIYYQVDIENKKKFEVHMTDGELWVWDADIDG